MNPFELLLIAASFMQNLAVVVLNINPKIQLVIAGSQILCLVESFAVFPERAAWPCEGVYWVQPITRYCPLGARTSIAHLASPRKQAENGSLAVRLPAGVQSGRQSNSLLADLTQIVSANLD